MHLLPPIVPIEEIENRKILKKLSQTRAALAELKGVASSIPNEQILIDTLSLQEAKDSSEIENIITTHDEIYQVSEFTEYGSAAAKEVRRYAEALKLGFNEVKSNGIISLGLILKIQEVIEGNNAGIRKTPGTVLRNDATGEVVYTPPQDFMEIQSLLDNFEKFLNDQIVYDVDPLIKLAIIHHQFETIHPFYDGNGRTGRILNVLYLIKEGLLNLPILYLSRYIIRNRTEYYRLLQDTRTTNNWEPWILYILEAIEKTSISSIGTVKSIKNLMLLVKKKIRSDEPRIYSQDLINNLFRHPYTKIAFIQSDLKVSRLTATKYLDRLCEIGILDKVKIGRNNYYLNGELFTLLKDGSDSSFPS